MHDIALIRKFLRQQKLKYTKPGLIAD